MVSFTSDISAFRISIRITRVLIGDLESSISERVGQSYYAMEFGVWFLTYYPRNLESKV